MLSEHQLNQKRFLHLTSDKTAKLITDLTPKIKYVCHYRTLKLYLELGYKVTKIHQILMFDQEPWMKPYIDKNTNLRKQANNDFEKFFFMSFIFTRFLTFSIVFPNVELFIN